MANMMKSTYSAPADAFDHTAGAGMIEVRHPAFISVVAVARHWFFQESIAPGRHCILSLVYGLIGLFSGSCILPRH